MTRPGGADAAIAWMLSRGVISPGYCLWFCQEAWQSGHSFPDASSQWRGTGQHTDMSNIPHGAPVFWTGGSRGHGHIALWDARTHLIVSTDLPTSGRVGRAALSDPGRRWGLNLVGWGSTLNHVSLPLTAPAVPKPVTPTPLPGRPVVSLRNLRASILEDGPRPTGYASNRGNTLPVEEALARAAGLPRNLVDGSAGKATFGAGSAYQRWQVMCGFRGLAADGYPPEVLTGSDSFARLGRSTGIFNAAA